MVTEALDLLFDSWRRRSDQAGRNAVDALEQAGLPDRRCEGWRWSDLRAALSRVRPSGTLPYDPFAQIAGNNIDSNTEDEPRNGLSWRNDLAPLAAVMTALADRRLRVDITTPSASALLIPAVDGNDRFDRTDLVVGAGIKARLIESRLSSGGVYGNTVTIHLHEGAHLERIIYQAGATEAIQVTMEDIRLEAGAKLTQTTLTAGAGYARTDATVTMLGQAASARMDALYVLGDGRHADLTTLVDHRAPGCSTRQTTRGVVGAGGRGVFQGKFLVARPAQQTDANMRHGAVLLDADAWAFARPELEIYADDVACAHGNAIGALDKDALSYTRQRGLTESEARSLLAQGFVVEALDALSAEDGLRTILEDMTDRWIARTC